MVFKHPTQKDFVSVNVDGPVAIGSEVDRQEIYEELAVHVLIRVDNVVRIGDEFKHLGRRDMRTKCGFLKRP